MAKPKGNKSPISKFYDTKHAIEELLSELDKLCENDFLVTPEEITQEHVNTLAFYEERLLEIALHTRNIEPSTHTGVLLNETKH